MPSIIRLELGSISVSNLDFISLVLCIALFLNIRKNGKMPQSFVNFFLIDFFVCFVLILLSSQYVPIEFQIESYVKVKILREGIFCISGFYAFSTLNIKKDLKILWFVAIICGFYGIGAYLINLNPYITGLSILYSGEEEAAQHFLDETRAGLIGRAYGTMEHPLAWGQFWNILIIFVLSFKKDISKWALGVLLIVGVVNIVLCGSRSALIALLLSVFLFSFKYGINVIFKYATCTLVLLTFFMVFSDNKKIRENDWAKYFYATVCFWDDSYAREANIIGSSSSMRENQLNAVIDVMAKYPFGVGYDYQTYARKTGNVVSDELLGLESVVFKKNVEQGFLGFMAFFICLYIFFRGIRRYAPNNEDIYAVMAFYCGYLSNIIFTGMQENNWTFFVVLSFCYYYKYKNSNLLINANSKFNI